MKDNEVTLDTGVWQDELGKHMRFSVVDLGVAFTLDILPVREDQEADQAAAVIAMATDMEGLIAEALDHAHHCPSCQAEEGHQ